MLRPEVIAVLKQSVPILAEHGENITRRFYEILFERYPELKNIFNLSNQRNGNQARALADAIFGYANLAEQPELLIPLVNRIAHKHTSLDVRPQHYPMVGESLLAALSEKLNLPMSHDIIQAWGEAYEALAGLFIDTEENLYQDSQTRTGGWQGFREFVVAKVVVETASVKSFYLQPNDDNGLALFQPGQYVGVKLDVPGHPWEEIRQYSLSDSPGQSHYRISVKAEPGNPKGRISNHLNEYISEGSKVLVSAPCGDFVLPPSPERDVVLISGGVGITPLMSMLKAHIHGGNDKAVTFIHCAQNRAMHSLSNDLDALRAQHDFACYSAYAEGNEGDHQGFLSHEALDKFLPTTEADYYFCGPFPFMVALRTLLLERGVAEERMHYEVFGPTLSLAA